MSSKPDSLFDGGFISRAMNHQEREGFLGELQNGRVVLIFIAASQFVLVLATIFDADTGMSGALSVVFAMSLAALEYVDLRIKTKEGPASNHGCPAE